MQGKRHQTWLFLGENLSHRAAVLSGPAALMGNLVAPSPCLPVAFGQRGKSPSGPERIAHIANGPFHASFLISRAHLTGSGSEVVMGAEFDQARVELNVPAPPLQHGRFQIVVEQDARLSVPCLEGMHMAAQEVFRGLVEEELQIQSARPGQRHEEAGQGAAGAADHDVPEVCPVDLGLLAGKRVQTQERLADLRPQTHHRTTQLDDAAAVTAIANHVIDACGAQSRMLLECFADEAEIRIDD
jgi:hypothetical protein